MLKWLRGLPAPNVEEVETILREIGPNQTVRLMKALGLDNELEEVLEVVWPPRSLDGTKRRRHIDPN